MKVYSVLLIIVFSLTTNNFSQVQFTSHTITTGTDEARSVYAIDVDGDGDIDVLSASFNDDKIAWYQNNGNENFTFHSITKSADGASSVYAVDLDGDGHIDVLSASFNDDKIAWYQNNGNESFTQHIISTNALNARSVYTADVDGDGDMDVLSASAFDNKIAWYENDGIENFSPHTITTDALNAASVYAMDEDGDGDMDVLSASGNDKKIAWYENTRTINIVANLNEIPSEFILSQNYPNPFNPSTKIRFEIPFAESGYIASIQLTIYNVLGREVITLVNEEKAAGSYEVEFDSSRLSSGIYFYRLQAGSFVETKKMVLLR